MVRRSSPEGEVKTAQGTLAVFGRIHAQGAF